MFRFASGVCATLTVSHAANEPQDTLQIFGSAGSVHLASLNQGTLRIVTEHGERSEALPPADNLHQPLIEDFVAAVLNDREPAVTGTIGRAVAKIEEGIYGKNAYGSFPNKS
jgi:predicted dehydrogenase